MSNPSTKGRGKGITFLREHVNDAGGACLIWPMNRDRDGYGMLGFNGRQCKAHRLMCEMIHGPAPSPTHHAAHSCGNGHGGCVHPRHLSWKTPKENGRDMVRHGRSQTNRRYRLKLTAEQVAGIRALKGVKSHVEIAAMFGCTDSHVRKIHQGITRPAAGPSAYKVHWFTPEEDAVILAEFAKGTHTRVIAEKLDLSHGSIHARYYRLLKKMAA